MRNYLFSCSCSYFDVFVVSLITTHAIAGDWVWAVAVLTAGVIIAVAEERTS